MRFTFHPDDSMVITIPLASLRNVSHGDLMPEKFTCVFKDAYKVFLKGRPKELGVAQFSIGASVICIGSILSVQYSEVHLLYTLPSILFVICGILTFAAATSPLMPVVKLSFIFNILSIFWSITALILSPLIEFINVQGLWYKNSYLVQNTMKSGFEGLVSALCGFELFLAVILIYWESKAVCRSHFNTLPMITIKQDV